MNLRTVPQNRKYSVYVGNNFLDFAGLVTSHPLPDPTLGIGVGLWYLPYLPASSLGLDPAFVILHTILKGSLNLYGSDPYQIMKIPLGLPLCPSILDNNTCPKQSRIGSNSLIQVN